MTAAGQLRTRGQLQRPQETSDGMGGTTVQWVDVATLWMALVAGTGREFWNVQHAQPTASHSITLRYRADVRPTWRVLVAGKTYRILHVGDDPQNPRVWQTLTCEEQVVCE